eukprot:3916436-Amphidinium_carterae.1
MASVDSCVDSATCTRRNARIGAHSRAHRFVMFMTQASHETDSLYRSMLSLSLPLRRHVLVGALRLDASGKCLAAFT